MKRAPRGQLARFRVFPEPGTSRLHFRVRVFRSEDTLRAYVRTNPPGARSLGRYGRAMCTTWQRFHYSRGQAPRVLPDMGEILLTKRWLGMEVLTHECTHAAVGWAQRLHLAPLNDKVQRGQRRMASPEEERFCYGLGQMARQLAARLYDRKLLPA